jgi:polyvinyl alcohol dehydrogenase (cytochrome)
MMRSQPVVYHGRLYVASDRGTVSALDAATGCTHWEFKAANVRSGLSLGRSGARDALFFGDATGAVHALDLSNGTELWQAKISDHKGGLVTGTPAYANGRVYVGLSSAEEVLAVTPGYVCCTFRGSVSAVDAATGKILWQTHTIPEAATARGEAKDGRAIFGPSGAGVWASPTVDAEKNTLYVTTGDNYSDPATDSSDAVLAFALDTGKLLWSKQLTTGDVFNLACANQQQATCKNGNGPDFDFGASPILMTLPSGRRCLLLGQKSGMVYAIDPDRKGELLWQARAGRGGSLGGVQWGPATDGHALFVAVSDIAFTKSPNPMELAADPKVGGGISAYRVESGEVEWKAAAVPCGDRPKCSPAQSAAVTAIPGAVFSGSLDGHIRAYAAADGKILWDYDTERAYDTVNQVPGNGGSIDAAGPVIAEGMVFVLSGYSQFGGKPGNVLLAFGRE